MEIKARSVVDSNKRNLAIPDPTLYRPRLDLEVGGKLCCVQQGCHASLRVRSFARASRAIAAFEVILSLAALFSFRIIPEGIGTVKIVFPFILLVAHTLGPVAHTVNKKYLFLLLPDERFRGKAPYALVKTNAKPTIKR